MIIGVFVLRGTAADQAVSKENCKVLNNVKDQDKCWDELLISTLNRSGMEGAFSLFDTLYKEDSLFVSSCHDFAHTLGEEAYQLVRRGEDFDFVPQTASCGYGFYHGLTELLIQSKGAKEAGKLCDSKKSQLTQVLYDACYHGIGHGALSQTAQDQNIWGNVSKMVGRALHQCEEANDSQTQRARCASGVFMELRDYMNTAVIPTNSGGNRLSICKDVQDPYRIPCYTQLITGTGSFHESAKLLETIEEDRYATSAMITLAASSTDLASTDQKNNVLICRDLQKRLHLACIQGIALGFMLMGKPGLEYEQAIDFCISPTLSEEEKDSCFVSLVRQSREMYSQDTVDIVCKKIETESRYCID